MIEANKLMDVRLAEMSSKRGTKIRKFARDYILRILEGINDRKLNPLCIEGQAADNRAFKRLFF